VSETPLVQPLREICDHWAAAKAAYIERLVETAPPLTPEQRDRLATLLRGTPEDSRGRGVA
jgi:hypothetical protein